MLAPDKAAHDTSLLTSMSVQARCHLRHHHPPCPLPVPLKVITPSVAAPTQHVGFAGRQAAIMLCALSAVT